MSSHCGYASAFFRIHGRKTPASAITRAATTTVIIIVLLVTAGIITAMGSTAAH